MGVLRLSIWVVRGRICFIRKRVFGIIDGVVCGCELSRFESSRVWGLLLLVLSVWLLYVIPLAMFQTGFECKVKYGQR